MNSIKNINTVKLLIFTIVLWMFLVCCYKTNANAHDIQIITGDDRRQEIGKFVFQQSILNHTNEPVHFMTLDEKQLIEKKLIPPKWDNKQVSPFGRSRWLAPYLSGYKGWTLYVDGTDMMVRTDILKLWNLKDDKYSVMVIKHDMLDINHTNYDRKINVYEKFNWSSVILFNNAKCKHLTPEYVYSAPYENLHQFKWLNSDNEIGSLPKEWNHLIGYYPYNKKAKLIHWTRGLPLLGGDFSNTDFADEWYEIAAEIIGIYKEEVKIIFDHKSKKKSGDAN